MPELPDRPHLAELGPWGHYNNVGRPVLHLLGVKAHLLRSPGLPQVDASRLQKCLAIKGRNATDETVAGQNVCVCQLRRMLAPSYPTTTTLGRGKIEHAVESLHFGTDSQGSRFSLQ